MGFRAKGLVTSATSRSVIVSYLDSVRVAVPPLKTNPILIVDADAVLAAARTSQCFQPVTWQCAKVIQGFSCIQHSQLLERLPGAFLEATADARRVKLLGLAVSKRPNQP